MRTDDEEAAKRAAFRMVTNDWLEQYVSHPRDLPVLVVDEVQRTSWWQWLRWHNRGQSFYQRD